MYWSDNFGWIIAKFMFFEARTAILRVLANANYVVLTYDKVRTIDNGSWSGPKLDRVPYLSHLRRLWKDMP